jgi:hypothetical protein
MLHCYLVQQSCLASQQPTFLIRWPTHPSISDTAAATGNCLRGRHLEMSAPGKQTATIPVPDRLRHQETQIRITQPTMIRCPNPFHKVRKEDGAHTHQERMTPRALIVCHESRLLLVSRVDLYAAHQQVSQQERTSAPTANLPASLVLGPGQPRRPPRRPLSMETVPSENRKLNCRGPQDTLESGDACRTGAGAPRPLLF